MTLQFEDESSSALAVDTEQIAKTVIDRAAEMTGCPYEIMVSLLITDDEQIREMNRQFRQIDRATDVLSFPMLSFEQPGDFSFLEGEDFDADAFDPETGELVLGDIVISAPHVRRQAEEYGHSIEREYAFLIAHSMLHLMGFDHMTPEEDQEMQRRQEEILTSLQYTR